MYQDIAVTTPWKYRMFLLKWLIKLLPSQKKKKNVVQNLIFLLTKYGE